jgi:uncharacterized protein (DUF697 family)
MHDINRTQLETGWEAGPYSANGYEYEPEHDGFGFETSLGPNGESIGSLLSDAEIMDLATELLGITDEAELDQFLGSLFRKVASKVGKLIRSPVGRALGGALKGVARQALPAAGTALGNIIAPGVGGQIGGQLASGAGKIFGLELEGLSPEDQEFEIARRYVGLASDAARTAAMAPPDASPEAVVQNAMSAAAQRYAPGLLGGGRSRGSRGVWNRRGRTIVLYGV